VAQRELDRHGSDPVLKGQPLCNLLDDDRRDDQAQREPPTDHPNQGDGITTEGGTHTLTVVGAALRLPS
jgi:hypothetical protein